MSNAATFAFADIAGFTALTEAHGDEAAFALVTDFTKAVRAELDSVHAEHVKTIGDALMLRIPDPGDGIVLGLRIANDLMLDHGAPAVRVGLHHGSAVETRAINWARTSNPFTVLLGDNMSAASYSSGANRATVFPSGSRRYAKR